MSMSPPVGRRQFIEVRLTDVPIAKRLRFAESLMHAEEYPEERLELLKAAHFPSDRTYVVELESVYEALGTRATTKLLENGNGKHE